jgi:hypothetical protein
MICFFKNKYKVCTSAGDLLVVKGVGRIGLRESAKKTMQKGMMDPR